MKKTYEIVDASIELEGKIIVKQNIIYYENEEDPGTPEFYSKEGVVMVEIRPGYTERK